MVSKRFKTLDVKIRVFGREARMSSRRPHPLEQHGLIKPKFSAQQKRKLRK